MTNIEIANVLLQEARAGRLEPAMLPHFINSLEYGGPVPDPKQWLCGIADSMPDFIFNERCKGQLRDIAARWDEIAGTGAKLTES